MQRTGFSPWCVRHLVKLDVLARNQTEIIRYQTAKLAAPSERERLRLVGSLMKLKPPREAGDAALVAAGILTLIAFCVLFATLPASPSVAVKTPWANEAAGQAK